MSAEKEKKKIYYTDELNDDFAPTTGKLKKAKISGDYKYLHNRNPVYKFFEFIFYRLIATPVAFIYMYVFKGLRIKNRKNLRKIKSGYFLYANHVQTAGDAFTPSLVTFPKRANILVGAEAVSAPVLRRLVPMMGGMPVPSDLAGTRNLRKALNTIIKKKQAVVIYPEAHIWEYYNGIRDFKAASFAYPFIYEVPAVGYTVTFRQRKIFKNGKPRVTVTVGEPIYPKECADKKELRDKIYWFMKNTAEEEKSYAYIEYIKKEESNENNDSL